MESSEPGSVALVGAGPGDPRLFTLAGVDALRMADIVLYDALLSPALLAHCRPGAELIDVGKRAGAHSMTQDEINALLVARARTGRRVVRLKGGDPFVFGRGGEEALACRAAGVPFTVIPGVTSAVAAPACAGIPVTQRGMARSFAVVTGSEAAGGAEHDWAALAKVDTLVVLMGAAALPAIAAKLMAAGIPGTTPAASISNGTLPQQQVVTATLETIAHAVVEAALPTPLLTVIGEVASLAETLAWRESLPLTGRRVVITRTRAQASQLRLLLESLGAAVVEAPVLEVRLLPPGEALEQPVRARWDWVVFASQNGVAGFFAALRGAGRDARSLGTAKVAAVGAATAASLAAHGVLADFAPSLATGERLAAELPISAGARILLPGGPLGGEPLAGALRARGAEAERVQVYETLAAPLDAEHIAAVRSADVVTFASASSARFLAQALSEEALPEAVRLCAIGPQAAEAAREAFGRVDVVASVPSLDGLATAVVEALR